MAFGFAMNWLLNLRLGRVRNSASALLLVAFVGVGIVPRASADELKLAIILTRHGVRAPIESNEKLAKYSTQAWPAWEVGPGIQTPRGDMLIGYMGDYYRERFTSEGLLLGDPNTGVPWVYIRADNSQRTIATGRILGKALVPGSDPEVHSLPTGAPDPLFKPYLAHAGHPDMALAEGSILGRIGGDARSIEAAYTPQVSVVEGILFGPGGPPSPNPFAVPTSIAADYGEYPVKMAGRIRSAWVCSDALLLEYFDGKPMSEVGWGRESVSSLQSLLALQKLSFDLVGQTRYVAQILGSNLASHIVDTLEQSALGQPVPGAIGPTGSRVVIIAGHDGNIANIGALFGMDWWIPGTQPDPLLPGGALVFELWQHDGQPASYYVRTSYVSQTLDQLRNATPLSLDTPPARSPIFVPGSSGPAPDYDAPLDAFVRHARLGIDPAFIAEEPVAEQPPADQP
jgi:4-phytase/acid phosphatase